MTTEVLTPTRTLTVAWEDPSIGVTAGRGMRGIDYLQAMANGELPPPPIGRLLGMQILEVEQGRVVFGVVPGEQHYNPLGTAHRGLAATLFDSAMGCSVLSTLPAGSTFPRSNSRSTSCDQ
jgi:acyl-coenzyme A thioesterase PaaI-like protein